MGCIRFSDLIFSHFKEVSDVIKFRMALLGDNAV